MLGSKSLATLTQGMVLFKAQDRHGASWHCLRAHANHSEVAERGGGGLKPRIRGVAGERGEGGHSGPRRAVGVEAAGRVLR